MMQRARQASDPFLKAKLGLDIIDNQRKRAALQSMLQAVDATGRGVPPQWSLAELEADLATTLSRVELRAEGEDPWRDMLAGTLSDTGFTVVESGPYETRLSVNVNAQARPVVLASRRRRAGYQPWRRIAGTASLGIQGIGNRCRHSGFPTARSHCEET